MGYKDNDYNYEYHYCPTCDVMSVGCPECGNSTCNGGCGCDDTWDFYERTETPDKPDDWRKQQREYQQWISRNFKE